MTGPAESSLFALIDSRLSAGRPLTLAIDGCCAAGKTTLARRLQEKYGCPVFHADDYFLQPYQRTPERLAQPGGNMELVSTSKAQSRSKSTHRHLPSALALR